VFRFANPYAFLLLLPLVAAAYCLFRRRRRSGLLFSALGRLPAATASWRTRILWLPPVLFLLAMVAAIVGLARPQTVLSQVHRQTEALGIMMTVDISGSMRALDLSDFAAGRLVRERTRLDVVKEVFAGFVRRRPDDLIGLVTFGGYASTRAPLTLDHDALQHVLRGVQIPSETLDAGGNIVGGEEFLTAIGDALATSCARLQHAPLKSRLIVLLSDGESNTGIIEPLDALRAAKKLGVRIYTIGVGSNADAPFKARDRLGREVYVRAQVTMDEALLRKIAAETGGLYFNARDAGGLEKALERIDELEKTKVEKDVYRQFEEHVTICLAPALALFGLAVLLNMGLTRRIV
jgi:Ca-activated chloride channel family protein